MVATRLFLTVSKYQENIWSFKRAKKIVDAAQLTFAAYVVGQFIDAINATGNPRFTQNYVARVCTSLKRYRV